MKQNTAFNRLKLKTDTLYLPLSGGKVNGETIFSKPVTFESGEMTKEEIVAGTATKNKVVRADYLHDAIEELAGGGGGTTNYNDLSNKPQINGHSLSGDQSAADLGLATDDVVSTSANGLVPKVTDTNNFLKGDGTWATPPSGTNLDSLSTSTNTITDNDLVVSKENGATDWVKKSASKVWDYIKGKIGISTTGSTYLKKDGTWGTPTDTKYDITVASDNKSVTLTEDGSDKTEIFLQPIFTGTRTAWNQLSVSQKVKYRIANFTDDGGVGDAYNIPYATNKSIGAKIDDVATDLGSPSSASGVTGADAFSKIASLNSALTNIPFSPTSNSSALNGAGSITATSNAYYRFNINPNSGYVTVKINNLTAFYADKARYSAILYIKKGATISVSISGDAVSEITKFS